MRFDAEKRENLWFVRSSAHVFLSRLMCSMLGRQVWWCAVLQSSIRIALHGHFFVLELRREYAFPWLSVSSGMEMGT